MDKVIRIDPKTWTSFYNDVWECRGKQKSCKAIKKLFKDKEWSGNVSSNDALSDAYLMWYYWNKTRAIA